MIRKITCIECPLGCVLSVTVDNGRAFSVAGNKCPRGEEYAVRETEKPERTVTSTIPAEGLEMKMVPVKTAAPVPKESVFRVMECIRNGRISAPVKTGDVVIENIADSGIDLVATRECRALTKGD